MNRKFKSSYFDSVHCPEKTSPHISNLRFFFHFFSSVSLKTIPSKFLHHQKNQLSQSHLDLYQHLSKAWDVNRNAARGTAGLCGRVSMFFFSLQGGWDYKIDMHLRDVLSLLIFPPEKTGDGWSRKSPVVTTFKGIIPPLSRSGFANMTSYDDAQQILFTSFQLNKQKPRVQLGAPFYSPSFQDMVAYIYCFFTKKCVLNYSFRSHLPLYFEHMF